MVLRTTICELFDIEVPIVLAGMGGAAGPELAAAVSNAGGLGVLGAATCSPEELDEWITRTRRLTDRPFGVDTLLPASVPDRLGGGGRDGGERATSAAARIAGAPPSDDTRSRGGSLVPPDVLAARDRFMDEVGLPRRRPRPSAAEGSGREGGPGGPGGSRGLGVGSKAFVGDFFKAQLEVVADHRVPVYVAGLGVPSPEFMAKGRPSGMRFMGVAGQSRHAEKLAAAGVDAVVAQGTDGGGHNSPIGTMALIPQVVDAVGGRPVLGAGGIADGRGIAAALMLGARGVWLGTRFLATPEANIPDYQKQVLVRIGDRDTVVSRSLTGKPARAVRGSWAEAYERGELVALPMPLQSIVSGPVLGSAVAHERADVYAGLAGQGVGMIHELTPAADVVARLVDEAVALLDGTRLPGVTVGS